MDFDPLEIFTPVFSLDFEIEFLNYQEKIVCFYIPSSRNIIYLKVEVKLDFSLRLEINETVRLYYELICIKNMIHLIHSYFILNPEPLLMKKSTYLLTSSKFSINGF